MYKLTISGMTRSKKNSKRVFAKKNKMIVIPSKGYSDWEKEAIKEIKESEIYETLKNKKWNYPIEAHFKFYRKTRHRFDYNNLAQGIQDILVKLEIIEDDSMLYLIPVFNSKYSGWEIDKDNPRLEVTFIENANKQNNN